MPIEQINTSTGTVSYLHHDQAGSTRLITGSTGTVTGKCSYGAYGAPTCEGSATTPLGWDAQYTSSDTGLIYMRARVYDPATAQFLTRDPLTAISGEPYSYVGDNPLNRSDPTGLLFGIELPSGPFANAGGQLGVGPDVSLEAFGAPGQCGPIVGGGVSAGAGLGVSRWIGGSYTGAWSVSF